MARNKKKKSSVQQQKLTTKEIFKKQENEYRKGLIEFLKRMDLFQHLSLLPDEAINSIIHSRISSVRIEPSGKKGFDKDDDDYVKGYLKKVLMENTPTPYPNGEDITFREYLIYFVTLAIHVELYVDQNDDEKVKKAFGEMISFVKDNFQVFLGHIQFHMNFSSLWMSNPIDGYINYEIVKFDTRDDKQRTHSDSYCTPAVFYYKLYDSNKKSVSINGKRREVYEMAHISLDGDFTWCTIHPSCLKKSGDAPIRVFIQRHALNRMEERLDIISHEMQLVYVSKSVVEAKKVKQNGEDSYLIPAFFYNQKLGYLVAHYVDSILVVTTFLFITQEGTPEGMLLNKLTGFKKLDKSHLCIDKLSTFVNSDIASKPELAKLLQDANLGHLVDISQKIDWICKRQGRERLDPSFIMEYIQKKQEEEQLSLTEQQEIEQVEEVSLTPIPIQMDEQPMLLPLENQQAQVTSQPLV